MSLVKSFVAFCAPTETTTELTGNSYDLRYS